MSFNILIVDDSPLARKIVRKTLAVSGLETGEVHEAGNGREALELLARHWVDLIFADIHMPEMDGHEMLERMAKSNLLASIPVVVVSSDQSEARIEYLTRLGVKAWLNKPLSPQAMRETVLGVLLAGAGS